jgi:hypothetical protein
MHSLEQVCGSLHRSRLDAKEAEKIWHEAELPFKPIIKLLDFPLGFCFINRFNPCHDNPSLWKFVRQLAQFQRRADRDSALERACNGTTLRVNFVDSLDCLPLIRGRIEPVAYVNTPGHKDVSFQLNLARGRRSKLVVTGVDVARLQRASECPCESTGSGGYNVI